MSWDAANQNRTREGSHYQPAKKHSAEWMRPSRAKPKDEFAGLAEIIDRGYRTSCRKRGLDGGKF